MPYLSDISSALNIRSRPDSHPPQLTSTNSEPLYPTTDNSSSAALLAPAPGNLRHEGRPKKLRGEGGQLCSSFFCYVVSTGICIDVSDREIASSFGGRDGVQAGRLFPALFRASNALRLHPCLWFMSLHNRTSYEQMALQSFCYREQSHITNLSMPDKLSFDYCSSALCMRICLHPTSSCSPPPEPFHQTARQELKEPRVTFPRCDPS